MVNGQGIIAVHITEESEKQGTAEGPWLAFVIAEILYLKANFLHYFSVNSFFNGFSDFCKACDKGVTLKSAALIFGKNDFISVCDSYDYCRTQDRVLLIAAGRAFQSYVLFGCAALVFHSSRRTGACCTTGKADVL